MIPFSPTIGRGTPSTPCVKLCWLDPATGLCEGCGRTRDEIARWASLDEAERRAVMDQLPARLATGAGMTGSKEAAS